MHPIKGKKKRKREKGLGVGQAWLPRNNQEIALRVVDDDTRHGMVHQGLANSLTVKYCRLTAVIISIANFVIIALNKYF